MMNSPPGPNKNNHFKHLFWLCIFSILMMNLFGHFLEQFWHPLVLEMVVRLGIRVSFPFPGALKVEIIIESSVDLNSKWLSTRTALLLLLLLNLSLRWLFLSVLTFGSLLVWSSFGNRGVNIIKNLRVVVNRLKVSFDFRFPTNSLCCKLKGEYSSSLKIIWWFNFRLKVLDL